MSGQKAVSPVVATLILILIAVAAAAALYLWLVAWQGNITGGIGNQQVQATFTIGGSTSVYPFSSLAATWYEQNHSDVQIQDDQGGTGAGMLSVCEGHVDVGAASTPETVSGLQASDNCPSTPGITITTIAYDAVDVVINGANPHGLLSINFDTLNEIYESASTSGNQPFIQTGTTPLTTVNNVKYTTITDYTADVFSPTSTYNAPLLWEQIPAAAGGATIEFPTPTGLTNNAVCGTSGTGTCLDVNVTEAALEAVGTGGTSDTAAAAPVGAASGASDLLCTTGGAIAAGPSSVYTCTVTDTTFCGFTVCAGGSGSYPATAAIVPIERSDASGTTQTFEAKLLGYTSNSAISSSYGGLGYSGCGSNNLLSDCNILLASKDQGNGNPGVLALVAGSENAIGYASDGLARTYSGVGTAGIVPFLAVGQSVGNGLGSPATSSGLAYGAVVPSTGATGTIAAGILDSATVNQYAGWRPFEFVTLQPPAGEVSDFFTFLLAPDVNQNLATATGEVSIYSI